MPERPCLAIVGGGPAGVFAALQAKRNAPVARVIVLEKSARPLAKVAISGGGRCNVTHACFDPRELAAHYPRGERELIGPFHRFGGGDTVAWFAERGVALKTEPDGRMFPVTDSSQTVIDCLLAEARRLAVEIGVRQGAKNARVREGGDGFELRLDHGDRLICQRLMLATGGQGGRAGYAMAENLGHTIVEPVPSLFTFHVDDPRLVDLAGVSVSDVEVRVDGTSLRQRGPLLVTGQGLSGPAILKLSAWGARELHAMGYRFDLRVNFAPQLDPVALGERFATVKHAHPRRRITSNSPVPLPRRLWEALAAFAGASGAVNWADLSRAQERNLVEQLQGARFAVRGKSPHKDEFVTCGGVSLKEVDFKRMESRRQPGLFFGGEILDIDGITGGFNFQAAWTTGWLAGRAMAESG